MLKRVIVVCRALARSSLRSARAAPTTARPEPVRPRRPAWTRRRTPSSRPTTATTPRTSASSRITTRTSTPRWKCAVTNGNTAPDGGVGMQPGCLQFAATSDSPKAHACMQDCITGALGPSGISRDCALCSAAVSSCGAGNCLQMCVQDPHSTDCIACLCKQIPDIPKAGTNGSCLIDVFADCAGFLPTAEQVGCPPGSK